MNDNDEKIEEGKRNFLMTTGALAAASMLSGPAGAATNSDAGKTGDTWKWLVGTTWCVPDPGTFGYEYDTVSNSLVKITWQTVYQITGYDYGCFWGRAVSQLNQKKYYSALVGMVGPDGFITLSFKYFDKPTDPAHIGYGEMIRRAKVGWTMQNQFCDPRADTTLVQWASMVITKPGDAYWSSLPAIGVSVPEFLADCPPAPKVISP